MTELCVRLGVQRLPTSDKLRGEVVTLLAGSVVILLEGGQTHLLVDLSLQARHREPILLALRVGQAAVQIVGAGLRTLLFLAIGERRLHGGSIVFAHHLR